MVNEQTKGKSAVKSFRDLDVCKIAFDAAMEIFTMSKDFPPEEKYSLTDQIRRSSRSVCTNIAEGQRKRKYPAMFGSKLLDAAREGAETQTWLDFALAFDYVRRDLFDKLDDKYEHIFVMLASMQRKAKSFCKTDDASS